MIARYAGGIPVILYDHLDLWRGDYRLPAWIPEFAQKLTNKQSVKEYQRLGKNIWRHVKYQAQGKPSGTHGLFHKCVHLDLTFNGAHALSGIESTPLLSSDYLPSVHMGSIRSGSRFSVRFPITGQSIDTPW